MKIKSVSTKQFAGLSLIKSVPFEDGINVVYGDNETGKSTLINLIYSLIWRNSIVTNKNKVDKEYRSHFFPADVLGGKSAEFVKGELKVEKDGTEYEIEKEWSEKGWGKLYGFPGGGKREKEDAADYQEKLKMLFQYGEGVFKEVIFTNQKTLEEFLIKLLNDGNNLETDLSSFVSQAVLDMGGISSEKFMSAVETRINDLGSCWDFTKDKPLKSGKKKGEVYKAHEAWEAVENKYNKLNDCKKNCDDARRKYQMAEQELAPVKDAYETFIKIYDLLKSVRTYETLLENEKNEIKKRSDAASDWASSENDLKKAETLLAELNRAEIKVQYESVEQKKREIQKKEDEINKIELIPVDDVNKAKKLEKEIKTILDRLRNFHAVIDFSVREGYELIVTSDVDGRLIDLGDGSIRISEAVKLEVPGVIELHLAAEEVDRVQMQADLKEKQDALQKLLQNYMAKDSSELEQMKNERSNTHNKLVNDLNSLQQERKTALSGKTEEELTEAYGKASVQPSRTKEEILEDAKSISGHPLSDCILLLKQTLKTYRESYESQEKNDEAIAQAKKKIEKYEKALEEAGNIPEEFQKISDPEKERDRRAKAKEAAEEKARKAEIDYSAEKALLGDMEQAEDYQSLEELLGEIEDSKKEFERAKSDYQTWIEIKAVAEGILASVKGNPYQSLEDDFRDYLTRLTDGRIKVQSMDSLKPTVYSKDYKMSKDILSEGTKETIALAFRLAVFHFLYPDGGGFLVLDDPFTDMDEGRRVRSIDLVKEFGEKNQIIVTTCDGQVRDKLKGHLIKMEEYVSG